MLAIMAKDDPSLERVIVGALRAAIRDHGPITPETIGSAAKRIAGNLVNAKAGALARGLGRKRFSGMSDKEVSEHQAAAASSYWAGMTKKQRSAEWKRRAEKAWETRRARAKAEPPSDE